MRLASRLCVTYNLGGAIASVPLERPGMIFQVLPGTRTLDSRYARRLPTIVNLVDMLT